MDKLIIYKSEPYFEKKYTAVRIDPEMYKIIMRIANTTHMPMSKIANKMLEFAAQHIEIVGAYPCPCDNTNCSKSDTKSPLF